jgi:F0F1-type ATP synthase membrane subunit b/b'
MVFYDRVVGFPWECPVGFALYDKLVRQGWTGQAFILKGNFIEFSASFEEYISGQKMTETGKSYQESLHQLKPAEEDLKTAEERYSAYLHSLEAQARVPTTELIPSRKAERIRAVEKHQHELELEMENAFPALWRKAKALSPPSPSPGYSESSASPSKDKDKYDNFDTKAPLVEPLVRGVAKMQEAAAAASGRSTSGQSLPSTPLPRYHKMASAGEGDKAGDDKGGGGDRLSTEEYDDFQNDETLRSDPEFMQAAAAAGSGAGIGAGQEYTNKVVKGGQRASGLLGFRFGRKTISK